MPDSFPADLSAPVHQRARGLLRAEFRTRDGKTVLGTLRQDGCLKARFPRPVDWTELVTLNVSGGIAGGDHLAGAFAVGPGARATFSSQAAERFYRALDTTGPSRVRNSLRVDAGAAAEWLPQESILFDRCALDRVLDIDLAADAWFLGVESLVFGRAAMGEDVRVAKISDTIRVRRDGQLLLHDAIRLHGPVSDILARPAVAAGGRAVATLIHVAPNAAERLDAVREALAPFEAGASAWNGMLVARMISPDGACLRSAVVAGLACLRAGRALPRVWMC